MNLQSEKTLRFARNSLKNHVMAAAVTNGVKESAATLTIANSIGVDRKSLKDFIEGTVVKPSKPVMQKYVDWLGVNPEKGEKSESKSEEDQRDKEIAEMKNIIRIVEEDRENLRLKYVEAKRQLEAIESVDPAHAERYQAVHPENSYWMQNSEAYIKVYTHDDLAGENKRLFTMPIPDLLEFIPRIDSESHEEWKLRTNKLTEERKQLLIKLSEQIADVYLNCGFPEQYVGVDLVTSRRHIG
jgi:hypothetical protein